MFDGLVAHVLLLLEVPLRLRRDPVPHQRLHGFVREREAMLRQQPHLGRVAPGRRPTVGGFLLLFFFLLFFLLLLFLLSFVVLLFFGVFATAAARLRWRRRLFGWRWLFSQGVKVDVRGRSRKVEKA